ncbi:MAG: hypothetical protein QM749_00430 [Aquabacterium sp.]
MRLIILLIAALLIGLIYLGYRQQAEWDAFKVEHKCKVTAHIDGNAFNTYSFDAKGNLNVGVGVNPDKTGWLCDDGITYFK